MLDNWRQLEINGGKIISGDVFHLSLEPGSTGYSDAQIDDYGTKRRSEYPWMPGTRLSLDARFSHPDSALVGTGGFGFWNAPFGDPTVGWPALPKAVWFFYASYPSDLPLALKGPGRGWFASTIDANTPATLYLAPLCLPIILLNHSSQFRYRTWPKIRKKLNIAFSPIQSTLEEWHNYQLDWHDDNCRFFIDQREMLSTNCSPRGPLGFVCWIDNQYLVATTRGRVRWGTISLVRKQWMEVKNLEIARF